MSRPESRSDLLARALREIAAADAPELLAAARERARIRAQALIEDALVDELVAAAARPRTGHPDQAARPADATRPTARARPAREPHSADHVRSVDDEARSAADGRSADPGDLAPDAGRIAQDELWWTYCVVSAEDIQLIPSELGGIEPGGRVQVVREGSLAALVSPVHAGEYGDDRLREHLEDLEWLERTARRHEAVLEEALEDVTIVPLRLCTLYRDLDGVRGLLRDYARPLSEGLRQVAGCTEWGIKVFAADRVEMVPSEPGRSESASSGAAYLQLRKQERVLAERATEVRAKCAEAIHRRVGDIARDATSNTPQRPELHGRDLRMLLNGAYLIERGRADELAQVVDVLRKDWEPLGFVIELTGPWPPYNFVSAAAGVVP